MNGRDSGVPKFPTFDALESVFWPAAALLVFVITAVLVDVMIILAARFRLVDLPNRRSAHALPTARGAGIAIAATASLAAVVVVLRWPGMWREILLGALLPSLAIGAVGIVDDTRPLRASLRLAIQLTVATAMTALLGPLPGIAIPGLPVWEFGWLGWPLTVLWIVGMINAFNFMDGADGMAALGAVVAGVLVAMIGFQTRSLGAMPGCSWATREAATWARFWRPYRCSSTNRTAAGRCSRSPCACGPTSTTPCCRCCAASETARTPLCRTANSCFTGWSAAA
jgi:UDP-N-acetylmuramyl pentapeptide phosphotransferase/UDP-N-acetylglucosamine-1-phosphate transferase